MKYTLLLLAFLPAALSQFTNVALNKPASQSSTYNNDPGQFGPQFANDGDHQQHSGAGYTLAHTNLEPAAWWKVDLQASYEINEVVVYNRPSYLDRLAGFSVELKRAGTVVFTYTYPGVDAPPAVINIPVANNVADEAVVQLPDWNDKSLNLVEVEVMGRPAPAGANGDPHFKMWTGEKYDFHGACDLVLLQNPAYSNGLGMDIHIRTKFTEQWSYISTAVLKIGDETLEVMGGHKSKYWINKVEGQELSSSILGFPISRKEVSSISTEYEVDLKDGSVVFFKTYKDFVRVEVDRAKSADFAESLGMMGSYEGKKIARDGKTVVEDNNEFGLEWQVLPSEPMLFHNVEGAQAPEKCPLPVKSQARRRLRESKISIKDAQIACARVSGEDRDSCIFDVLATNDKDMAGAY